MSKTFMILGRLRRDVMILETGEDLASLKTNAEQAVKQGRAEETFILAIEASFAASSRPWGNVDTFSVGSTGVETPASGAPLNPHHGEQESLDVPEGVNLESVRGNIQQAAEDGAKGPDTGKADRQHEEAKGAGAQQPKEPEPTKT